MEKVPTWMPVVALALNDGEGRLLLQQRPLGKHHGGLWEFPGGKVESIENPRDALVREIREELGISIAAADLGPALFADDGAGCSIVLILYSCHRFCGKVCAAEGQEWGWFTPAQAGELPMPPMDRAFLEKLAC